MRAVFSSGTRHSDAIVRPGCSQCGTVTVLVGIEQSRHCSELHTFECPNCEHLETAVAKATPLH